jgi:uncharacterized membrane protein YgaE (UPF0421/DUF939 family)
MPKLNKEIFLYIAKCVTGYLFIELLSFIFRYDDIAWCLISTLLVLTPDNSEAVPLAVNRIKANIAGGFVSIACLLIPMPKVLVVAMALAVTIIVCYVFRLMVGVRSALAAVIIVMMHEAGKHHSWDTALQRIIAVIAGCLIGLLITLIFHRRFTKQEKKPTVNYEEA